jgi:hypothetical protein
MIKYAFTETLTIKNAAQADPNVIGHALAEIAEKANGELLPKDVVDAARDPAHDLHKYFEWNDARAAEQYRIDQARRIIRCIRVEESGRPPSPAFLSVSDTGGTSYRAIEEIRSSAAMQAAVLARAEADLEAFEKRYSNLIEVVEFVKSARDAVRRRRERITQPAVQAAA